MTSFGAGMSEIIQSLVLNVMCGNDNRIRYTKCEKEPSARLFAEIVSFLGSTSQRNL